MTTVWTCHDRNTDRYFDRCVSSTRGTTPVVWILFVNDARLPRTRPLDSSGVEPTKNPPGIRNLKPESICHSIGPRADNGPRDIGTTSATLPAGIVRASAVEKNVDPGRAAEGNGSTGSNDATTSPSAASVAAIAGRRFERNASSSGRAP